MRASALVVAVVLAVIAPREAAADDTGFIGKERLHLAIDDCAPRPALDEAALTARAREHWDRNVVVYQQGDYQGAIDEIIAAYCLLGRTSWIRDIATAYERQVEYELAVAYLERFVLETDEPADRKNASARIQVLRNLKSSIKVATEPPGALVTIASEGGLRGTERANSDRPITLIAGDYTMTIELPGYEPIEQPLTVGIGKPYSFSYRLAPRRGRLRVQTVPGNARILVDNRLVGLGSYDGEIDLGMHEVDVDATGWLTGHETIEVVDGAVASVTVELKRPPENGRWMMIIGTTALGGYAGTAGGLLSASGSSTEGETVGATLLAGLAVGAVGGYLLVPGDIRHGTASFLLTSSIAGIANGTILGSLLSEDPKVVSSISLGGTAIGAATATILLSRFDVSEGQAAIYNSGMGWGFATGTLFAQIFDDNGEEDALTSTQLAITLAGTNVGLLTGALLARRYDVSRRRVIYIDLAGGAGLIAGLALQNAAASAGGAGETYESRSHFTLAGMAIGLGIGTFLTRNLDAPRLPKVHPQILPVRDAGGGNGVTVGIAGTL